MHPNDLIASIEETADGFTLSSSSGVPITVELVPWFFELTGGGVRPACRGLIETRSIALDILRRLVRARADSPLSVRDRRLGPIARLVHQQRARLFARVPQAVVAVQRAVFDVSWSSHFIAESEALYRDRWLVADLMHYRAAAIALASVDDLWWRLRRRVDGDPPDPTAAGIETLLGALSNWRGLFSPTGTPYRSLDRTLMNLPPGKLPQLGALGRFRLPRPVTDWPELTALCAYLRHHENWDALTVNHASIIHRADADAIRRAIARIGAHTRRRLHPRRLNDIVFAMRFVGDYPEAHGGRLGGLVTKAIRWHVECARRGYDVLNEHDPLLRRAALPTARPPMFPPSAIGIRFLETVGDLIDESRRMQHCVVHYAEQAVAGDCYLFHVDHAGEEATIQVGRDGSVMQTTGPRNEANGAAVWGRTQLSGWAKRWAIQAATVSGLAHGADSFGADLQTV